MGGNAFDNLRRLAASEYRQLEAELLGKLRTIYPRLAAVPYYAAKPDFGDMDVVVQKPKLERKDFEAFLKSIGSERVSYNSDNVSFVYQDFQIDLIFVEPEHFETALFYFAYNDLNNLVGRIAHKLGLKFGWDGLLWQIRTESGHRAEEILLSRSPREIYQFLGYDYDRWLQGFDSLEDLFAFVVSSPYFNPTIYDHENLNHINRTRNRKRKTYSAFLEWLAERPELPAYAFEPDKSIYLIRIHNGFADADFFGHLADYAARQKAYERRYAKFNGKLVQAWTGSEGKELGKWIQSFKNSHGTPEAFDAWLDNQSADQIAQAFAAFFQQSSEKA